MTYVLLTGAGFSRNWGGWLANEAFEYLIGSPEIDDHIRHLLWKHKKQAGGFEEALAELQQNYNLRKDESTKNRLDDLLAAIIGMFNYMNNAFEGIQFEPQNAMEYLIRTFLVRFDAIFTLNQDLLLERHYLNDNIALSTPRRWNGWQIPGVKPFNPAASGYDPIRLRRALRRLMIPQILGSSRAYSRTINFMDLLTGLAAAEAPACSSWAAIRQWKLISIHCWLGTIGNSTNTYRAAPN